MLSFWELPGTCFVSSLLATCHQLTSAVLRSERSERSLFKFKVTNVHFALLPLLVLACLLFFVLVCASFCLLCLCLLMFPCVYFLLELVPSFSWQMDVFIRKKRETESVFCGTVPIEPSQPAENVTLVLSFPYVCPKPVLVKCSFLYTNGAKSGVFRTQSVELC